MAQIKQVGAGRKTSGKVDGLVYVVRHGVTYARALPTMPKSMFNTPEARLRQAKFTLVQWYLKSHAGAIESLFDRKGNSSPRNQFYKHNAKALNAAFDSLAQSYVAGQVVHESDIESAVTAYASANREAILLANKAGYQRVYLTGAFPSQVTLTRDQTGTINVVLDNGNSQNSQNGQGSQPGGNGQTGDSGTSNPGNTGSQGGYDGD
ncbi:MAG: hypothetical protein MJZ62_03545 [Bacteroidales bacterium]|nr:hypothetical protein [Bacteroidales bacterium]